MGNVQLVQVTQAVSEIGNLRSPISIIIDHEQKMYLP
jgi:hypothetical protein